MSTLNRRSFIQTGTAALASAGAAVALPSGGLASPATATELISPAPGFYRFQLGDVRVTVLSDGTFPLPADFFGANVAPEQRAAYYRSRSLPLDSFQLPANPVLLETRNRRVLVDAGRGVPGDPPQATGRLAASLAAAGTSPDMIDLVILTHAHPDHIGGLIDPATGAARFPHAEVVVSAAEHALWTAEDVGRRVPAWVTEWGIVDLNRSSFTALGDRVRTVSMEDEILTGIRSVGMPGHTPGHIGVLVASGGEHLLLAGDALVTAHTQFEHPDWQLGVDHDPEQGARTRQRVLDRAATDRLLVHAYHLPFPGVGHAVRDGRSYRWLAGA